MLAIGQRIYTFQEEREAIESRLMQNFDSSQVPVQLGNVTFLQKGSETLPTPYKGDAFIRLNIVGGTSTRPEITRKMNQVNGLISFSIFTKSDIGSGRARRIADDLFELYNALSFNGIITDAASLTELPVTNSGWYNLNLSIPYRWYRCIA